MPQRPSIESPASYVTPFALGYSDAQGMLALVSQDQPLPISLSSTVTPAPAPTPLEGSSSQSQIVGPFVPNLQTPIHLQISGEWTGTVSVERSVDGGTTRYPLTVGGRPWGRFSGNANEPVWEESEANATFWLDISLDSGTVDYRVS